MDSLNINIGNVFFSITINNPFLYKSLKNILFPFSSSEKINGHKIEIEFLKPPEFKRRFPHTGSATRPLIEKNADNIFIVLCKDSVVHIDNNKTIIITSNINPHNISSTLLNDTVALRLIKDNAIMLHSSGILTPKGVFLFSGPSGSGKSTIAINANGFSVLNDETIIVRYSKGNVTAFGTPWFGTAKKMANLNGIVKAIFFIKISDEFKCIRINRPMSYFMLLQGVTMPFANEGFFSLQTNVSSKIIQSIPCYKLNFTYDMVDFWENLYDSIGQKEPVKC